MDREGFPSVERRQGSGGAGDGADVSEACRAGEGKRWGDSVQGGFWRVAGWGVLAGSGPGSLSGEGLNWEMGEGVGEVKLVFGMMDHENPGDWRDAEWTKPLFLSMTPHKVCYHRLVVPFNSY